MRRGVDQPQRLRFMGRLPTLNLACPRVPLLLVALLATSCQNDATKAAARAGSRERSEVVAAPEGARETKPVPLPSAARLPAQPTLARKVCDGQLGKPGRDLTKRTLFRKFAPGAKIPPTSLGTGKWLWINLWAAWCAPCKEEMPRLSSFAVRLADSGRDVTLAFVSLDDDERQLEQFLAAASEGTPRATYWLRDGRERDEWLTAIAMPKAPELPVHLLVDPRGKLRCVVNGAIDDGDYAELASVFSTP
jgi:thiol-disulfide isomerase/thioredoxin